jgi:multicomponent Na+:H+ antiporter subunit D
MLIAIGAATPLAISGAAAYAFVCALHSALAMMAVELAYRRLEEDGQPDTPGGLARSMPLTAALAVIAGLSALCAPLFAGFAARSVIGAALANEGRLLAWLAALAVTAGAVLHIGLRAPYEMFFGPDRGIRPKEASFPAQLAMGLAGFFCFAIGTNPGWLYELLPEPITFQPYEGRLAFDQLQVVVAAALAFVLAKMLRLYPTVKSCDISDLDWLYRTVGGEIARTAIAGAAWTAAASTALGAGVLTLWKDWAPKLLAHADRPDRPGAAPAVWLLAAAALLVACLYIFQAWPELAQ